MYQANLGELQELITRYGGMDAVLQARLQARLREGGRAIQQRAVMYVSGYPVSGWGGPNSWNQPAIYKRTGKLSRAIDVEAPYSGIPLSARIYADARAFGGVNYASVLEVGAIITPKRAKVLVFRVPGGPNAPAQNRAMSRVSTWARAFAYRAGLNASNSTLVHARRVVIPARPYMERAMNDRLLGIQTDLAQTIIRHFEGNFQDEGYHGGEEGMP